MSPRPQASIPFVPTSTTAALTTIFTPPPACTQAPWVYAGSLAAPLTPIYTRSYDSSLRLACFPEGASPDSIPGPNAVFFPGVCPSGYFPAQTFDDPSTHFSICCPSGMTWAYSSSMCASLGTATSVTGQQTFFPTFQALAHALTVAWNSDQLSLFSPASAPLLVRGSSSSSSSSSPPQSISQLSVSLAPSPSTTSSSPPSPPLSSLEVGEVTYPDYPTQGLSVAAQAGMGAGLGILGLFVIVASAVWVCCFRGNGCRSGQRRARKIPSMEDLRGGSEGGSATGVPAMSLVLPDPEWEGPARPEDVKLRGGEKFEEVELGRYWSGGSSRTLVI